MATADLGRLTEVPLRQVWEHEAKDFSAWLFNNLDILNDQLSLELSAIETEKAVGTFSLDLMAQDRDGRTVIIENQLEKTDHDHLGKVLTYLSNLEAKTAIWISSNPRPEHITAINYLNEVVPEDTNFYLLKVQAFKIGDSHPAPLFSVVAGPSPELKEGGRIKKAIAGTDADRLEFFDQLLQRTNKTLRLFDGVSPQGYQNWIATGAGKAGLAWNYVLRSHDCRIEFWISGSDFAVNKVRFDFLFQHKSEIESAYGEELDWDFKEDRKQHYIRSWCKIGGLKDPDKWAEIQSDVVRRMKTLYETINPFIPQLP